METKTPHFFEVLMNYCIAIYAAYKEVALEILAPVRQYITPYEDYLLIGIPVMLFLIILLILSAVRKRFRRDPEPIMEANEALEKPEAVTAVEAETVAQPMDEVEDVPEPKPREPETVEEKPAGILKNIRSGLSKTRKAFSTGVDRIFSGGSLDDDMLEDLEELLITSDVGVKTSMEIIENLTEKKSEISSPDDLKQLLKEEILRYVNVESIVQEDSAVKPHVMMVVGVNGVGKTTTIGKLASKLTKEGKKVLIVAADTFRAAASDQLKVWAERSGADIVRHRDNSDPSAVTFDGIDAAIAREVDVVIIDTAGRLHTKKNLMEELKKIKRTVSGKIPDAPHETLMVVDATTGQNALQQAQLFNDAIGITTIALTKLDGTAKGGIVIGITNTLNVPLKYVGVGEQVDDLQMFDPQEFADALI